MDLIERATEFEHRKHKFITTSDRIKQKIEKRLKGRPLTSS